MAQTNVGQCWKDSPAPERAYKRKAGVSAAAEQDRAAGGRGRRWVDLGDGQYARASVTLRVYRRSRRIRAYLRWWQAPKSPERYLGEVNGSTRAANLAEGWRLAKEAGLLAREALPAESKASSPQVRASMRANRGRDTGPELRLRSTLHRAGFRYRVDVRPLKSLRRRADVVFPKEQVAVFVDGCFWHGCPDHFRPSNKNSEFWRHKIDGNMRRDRETGEKLVAEGWLVLRFWEHEAPEVAAKSVAEAVLNRRIYR